MVDATRITHQYLEVVSSGSDADAARITHQYTESVCSGSDADAARITQQYIEAVYTVPGTDDKVRATQQYAEVLANKGDSAAARVTQQYVEVLGSLSSVADAMRTTQQYAEVMIAGNGAVKTTQQYAEAVINGGANDAVRATQQYAEILTGPLGTPSGPADGVRTTQQYAEVLTSGTTADALRVTQQYAEVLIGPTFTPPTATGTNRRITQQYAEVVTNGGANDAVRATQQYAEAFINGGINDTVRTTQQYAEVILKRVFTTGPINDKDVFLQAEAIRLEEVTLRTELNISGDLSGTILDIPVADILNDLQISVSGQSAIDILENSATTVQVNSSNLFRTGSGTAGTFIGSGGIFSTNSSGVTTFSIDGNTGEATFSGNITGGANIDIAGLAKFNGQVEDPDELTAAVWANQSRQSRGGLAGWGADVGTGFGVGVYGAGDPSGNNSGGYFKNANSTRPALTADSSNANNWGLEINGYMTITSSNIVTNLNAQKWNSVTNAGAVAAGSTTTTQVLNNKPGTSTAPNTWFEVTIGGVGYVIPVWKKDV